MNVLKNAWYMAGWSDELASGALLARTFLDQPVVMYRRPDGDPVALLDRCPHRVAPLSRGKLIGGTLQCGYHGLRFDGSGVCVENPHGAIPVKARVPAFPLVDRHGVLWIWMGDASQADTARIPDLSRLHAAPATAQSRGTMPSACNYLLIIDNVADLSHVEYLHASTLGGGAFVENAAVIAGEEEWVSITLESADAKAPPVYDRFLPQPGTPVTMRNDVTWIAPAVLKLDIAVEPKDAPPGVGLHTYNAHIVTPETATTCHYWYWLTRDYRTDDAAMTQVRHELMTHVFHAEDKPILEAQQTLLGTTDLYDAHPVLLATDGGPTRIRRALGRLLRQEAEAAAVRDTAVV